MFYEYALEPSVLSTWERARYFIDALGPSKGKFLAEYPKHWVRLVISTLSCGDYEKKRIVERLELAKKNRVFFRRPGAPFDGAKSWLDNAEVEHASARGAFHAVITTETRSEDFIVDAAHLDENDVRWKVDQGRRVTRPDCVREDARPPLPRVLARGDHRPLLPARTRTTRHYCSPRSVTCFGDLLPPSRSTSPTSHAATSRAWPMPRALSRTSCPMG